MEEQLKLVHEVIEVVDRPNRKSCVTLLRYKADNPETSYAQVRLFGRKNKEEKFQQILYVNYKLDEFVYLLDVMNSVYDKVFAKQPIYNFLPALNMKSHTLAGLNFCPSVAYIKVSNNKDVIFTHLHVVILHQFVLFLYKFPPFLIPFVDCFCKH